MSEAKRNILATLAYFDLFNYPLTMEELYLFLPARHRQDEFTYAMRSLAIDRIIFKFDNYYSLTNDGFLADRRRKGNAKAAAMIKTAKKVGDLLIRFPYVRGVAISGSLSKNFADEDSDIDLFIITSRNKLWIARTLMHCFKKLTFLFKKQHYFCMNYYIDEDDLLIHEKNIYTATEITTLMPLHGDQVFEQFFNINAWTRDYLPNKYLRLATAKPVRASLFKKLTELLFNNGLGSAIDDLLMKVTKKRWLKKMQLKKRNKKGIILAMDAGKHYTKPDPLNFQYKLITNYRDKVAQILERCEDSVAH